MHILEGNPIKLSFTYTAAATYLQWYRQYPRSQPEFLILVVGTLNKTDEKGRFVVKNDKDNKRVHLEISSAEVADSALYYCALQPTVTGNS